jgi:hypothetical protein
VCQRSPSAVRSASALRSAEPALAGHSWWSAASSGAGAPRSSRARSLRRTPHFARRDGDRRIARKIARSAASGRCVRARTQRRGDAWRLRRRGERPAAAASPATVCERQLQAQHARDAELRGNPGSPPSATPARLAPRARRLAERGGREPGPAMRDRRERGMVARGERVRRRVRSYAARCRARVRSTGEAISAVRCRA